MFRFFAREREIEERKGGEKKEENGVLEGFIIFISWAVAVLDFSKYCKQCQFSAKYLPGMTRVVSAPLD